MFQELLYEEGYGFRILVDSEFQAIVSFHNIDIIKHYIDRDLLVAENVVRMYLWLENSGDSWGRRASGMALLDQRKIDKTYPSLQYSEKYYPRVLKLLEAYQVFQ